MGTPLTHRLWLLSVILEDAAKASELLAPLNYNQLLVEQPASR